MNFKSLILTFSIILINNIADARPMGSWITSNFQANKTIHFTEVVNTDIGQVAKSNTEVIMSNDSFVVTAVGFAKVKSIAQSICYENEFSLLKSYSTSAPYVILFDNFGLDHGHDYDMDINVNYSATCSTLME